MGLKEGGVRGSLRSVSSGTIVIPDSVGAQNQWLHDEGSGTTLGDSSGSLDGTINGATWQSDAGRGGHYLSYDGTDDITTLPSAAQSELAHFVNSGEGSFGAWTRLDSSGGFFHLLGAEGTSTERIINALVRDDGSLQFRIADGSNAYDAIGGSADIGSWRPYAATADGSTIRVYYGLSATEVATGSIDNTASGDLTVQHAFGSHTTGTADPWAGGIDDVWTNSGQVPQSDIQQWIDATKSNYGL